jgi:hypothetical protein
LTDLIEALIKLLADRLHPLVVVLHVGLKPGPMQVSAILATKEGRAAIERNAQRR